MRSPDVAIAVIIHEGKVLLGRKPDDGSFLANSWVLPGGKQEPNEFLIKTCVREALEETGLRVTVAYSIGEHDCSVDGREWTNYFFGCRIMDNALGTEKPGSDLTELKWSDDIRADIGTHQGLTMSQEILDAIEKSVISSRPKQVSGP